MSESAVPRAATARGKRSSEAQAQSGEFETASGTIYYEILTQPGEEATERPWLTLIHNFMSTGQMAWGKIAPELLDTHRILLFDLPGHGRSTGYPTDFAYRALAGQGAALMQSVGAQSGHLAGCSAGGMIAQWLIHEEWVTPASLTLISTTHSMNPDTAGAPVTTDPDRFQFGRKWLDATAALHDPHQGEGHFRQTLLPAAGPREPRLTLDLSLDELAEWSMPLCIIHGEDDEFFPVQVARNMAAHAPAAQLHVIPGQSHALIFRQPWKVAELMRDFLQSLHKSN